MLEFWSLFLGGTHTEKDINIRKNISLVFKYFLFSLLIPLSYLLISYFVTK